MDHPEWMTEQVKGEIEDLRSRFGLEQDEAVACWHLRQAEDVMRDMWHAGLMEELEEERRGEAEAISQMVGLIRDMVWWESRVGQHFTALYRSLGSRVLRKTFPEGWGESATPADEGEAG